MENLGLWLYLADFVDNLSSGLCLLILGISIYYLTKKIYIAMHNEENIKFTYSKILVLIWIISFIGCIFIPSSKTIYIIAGLKTGQQVMSTDTGKKALNLLNLELDKKINDLTKDKTNG